MGTPSMIGYWDSATDKVIASYCHYDGYLDGNGRTLVEHYSDPNMAKVVATGGYLSGLTENYTADKEQSVHSDPAVAYESIEDYMKTGVDYAGAQYLYLCDGENWFFAKNGSMFEEVEMNLGKKI
jgi:hypothetical protein